MPHPWSISLPSFRIWSFWPHSGHQYFYLGAWKFKPFYILISIYLRVTLSMIIPFNSLPLKHSTWCFLNHLTFYQRLYLRFCLPFWTAYKAMFAFGSSLPAQFYVVLLHVLYLPNSFFELLGKLANTWCHVSMHEQSGKLFVRKRSPFLTCQKHEKGIFVDQVHISWQNECISILSVISINFHHKVDNTAS